MYPEISHFLGSRLNITRYPANNTLLHYIKLLGREGWIHSSCSKCNTALSLEINVQAVVAQRWNFTQLYSVTQKILYSITGVYSFLYIPNDGKIPQNEIKTNAVNFNSNPCQTKQQNKKEWNSDLQ